MQIITKNNLKTDEQLSSFATSQAREGKDDLQRWIAKHPNKKVRLDILSTAWTLAESETRLERSNMTRMELLQKALSEGHRLDTDRRIQCNGE